MRGGSVTAAVSLGRCYERGEGVPQSYEKAAEIYRVTGEEKGHDEAMVNLAILYLRGAGVPQDFKKAAALYKKAVALGCVNAMNNLGHCYEDGQGVTRNLKKAQKYYQMAMERGHQGAPIALAKVYAQRTVCRKCWKHREAGVKLLTCGGCRDVFYCSKECQKADWKSHRPDCKKTNPRVIIN